MSNSIHRLTVGDRAPEAQAFGLDGRATQLGDTWRGGPVLLVFLRHYG